MKIVLDTTILVRANERSRGPGRELLMQIIDGGHRLLLSNEILYELARVLRYPRLQAFYDLSENLVFDYIGFLRSSSEIVTLDPLVTAPIRDVNDVVVVQTAIIGEGHTVFERRGLRHPHTPAPMISSRHPPGYPFSWGDGVALARRGSLKVPALLAIGNRIWNSARPSSELV